MIKVKEFAGNYPDKDLNDFLAANENLEFIDAKYQVAADEGEWCSNVLLIYRERTDEP